ncbi:MAG: hypothetical protein H6839_12570 [Planctomycetes bacterium]|nr:hypothetical protein [Planctomycetota bacterium]
MRYLNWLTNRAKYLVPGAVAFCLLLLAFDLLAFWGLGRRPVVSTLEMRTAVWSLLIGSGCTYAARWAIMGERRMRHALAATLSVMVLVSALHPWLNGWGRDAASPVAPTLVASPDDHSSEALVFAGGALSEPEAARW